jgi:hypothetical protein
MPRELRLGLEFKTNTGQNCFAAGDFVFIKKRKKHWNIGTETTDRSLENKKNQTNPILTKA